MDESEWRMALRRLKYQLQALAMPAEVQLRLLPDLVCKADELAIDYNNWCMAVLSHDRGQLSEQQRVLLARLDEFFDTMSQTKKVWTDDAIRTRPEWVKVRTMAIEILDAFGWPVEEPAENI